MKDILEMVGVGVAMAAVMLWVVAPYRVSGESMLPTYKDGNMLLVNKLAYRFGEPEPGDVVILKTNYGVMVKRIIKFVDVGKYWVEGDNKERSTDSREYGPVERKSLVGRVIVKIW